ncbi:Major pollen allergen Ole e 10 [Heracleum sosnowskyi]|uniref:Major pollen allergen Ole e 10 n=1 Tax=Heracleum sosnowskyi TaxID=360622 RepID=A0AAD8I4F8_9APIA|nr:Major pollen allergen Ole e 10 [Heracleum sosnowskyi]
MKYLIFQPKKLFFLRKCLSSLDIVKTRSSWCILKPGSSVEQAVQNENFVCNYLNCDIIREGGACFLPEDVYSHASVLMNLYYQNQGGNAWNCDFSGSGLITISDPNDKRLIVGTKAGLDLCSEIVSVEKYS